MNFFDLMSSEAVCCTCKTIFHLGGDFGKCGNCQTLYCMTCFDVLITKYSTYKSDLIKCDKCFIPSDNELLNYCINKFNLSIDTVIKDYRKLHQFHWRIRYSNDDSEIEDESEI